MWYFNLRTIIEVLFVSAKINAKSGAGGKTSPVKSPKKNESSIDPAKRGRIMSLFKDWKGRASGGGSDDHQGCSHGHGDECKLDPALDEDVYDGLDASVTLLIHGLESDWIEEEMSDDDDFKWDFKDDPFLIYFDEYLF